MVALGDDHISVHFLSCAFTNWHIPMPQHVLGQPVHSQVPIDTPDCMGRSHKHQRKNNIVDLGPPRFKAEGQGDVSELDLQTGPGKQWQVELRERERHRLARTDKEGVWELQAGGGCCFYDIFFKGFCFFVLRFLYFFDPTQNLFFPLLMMLYAIYLFMPFSPYARRILTYFKRRGVFVYTCLYTYEQVPVTPG